MECKKCGSKWESDIKSQICPFCGENLAMDKEKNMCFDNMSEALRYIVNNYGIETYKKPKVLLSYLSDLAPKLSSEIRLIKTGMLSGVIEEIADNSTLSDNEKEIFIKKSVTTLCDEYFINDTAANKLLVWLTYGAGWSVKTNTNEKMNYQDYDRKLEKSSNIHSPETKKDGRTVPNRCGRVAVSAGDHHTVGLKSDGTVVVVGDNEYGQCNVSSWRDIVAVSAGYDYTVGLKSNGRVMAVGYCDVSSWKHIVAVSAGEEHTVGLKFDGTVVAVGYNDHDECNGGSWKDIVAVSAGYDHTVGLKSDGTVVAVGDNEHGQCNVSSWKHIVAVSAGHYHTVGLKSDGTVVAVGWDIYDKCNVSGWKDIVAISAGDYHTVGLKSDGTVVAVGDNSYGQCNISDWKDIIAVFAGYYHTVGLKSDGTVVAVGDNDCGQCNVGNWRDILV